ncbi:plastocyanin/azurin family copper-binding protein [Vibrio ostreae]|uniref:Blue (type 1) copper domain-containing protein n=1 Tax=Vibrio ostreae TaxID=2841925 RepID=A0A975U7S3_9VIBR|nr:plastocyanin/azurin family copper-binding protein [Vibrio ostreae]QXO16768.1 hypothetical protein KNV97_14955 [Vibrio ostreae]
MTELELRNNSKHIFRHFTKLVFVILFMLTSQAQAKEWTIKMLNYAGNESMVFEPAVIQAEVGDTVVFIPEHSGHYAQSFITPASTKRWQTQMDKRTTVKLATEGIHIYYCPPHLMMGMVGMIQVGRATNLDKVEKKLPSLKAKSHLKPQRVDYLLENIRK